MDFSNMFKPSGGRLPSFMKAKLKNSKAPNQEEGQQNEEESVTKENKEETKNHITNIVPQNLSITQEEMKLRRCLDVRRWYCLSRPQYQRSCGISSVVTVWNYLYSTLGAGNLQPISQEDAIVKLGLAQQFGPHFNEVEFGAFSGNMALIKWFKNLCFLHKVKGRAYYLWKLWGQNKTQGIDRDVALDKIKQGLQTDKFSYIYHSFDHYFCPIGYEITPNKGYEAFYPLDQVNMDHAEHWMIIAEPAKPFPFFTVRKWKDIAQDLELEYPKFTDIRKPIEGIREYKNPYSNGASMHCILAFERVDATVKKDQKCPKAHDIIQENLEESQEQFLTKEIVDHQDAVQLDQCLTSNSQVDNDETN